MEESRLVYEDATHQLGSFLELVSEQLTVLNHTPDNEWLPPQQLNMEAALKLQV